VIVSDLKRGSPAERGGFKVGDIIVEVNGERITDDDFLAAIVTEHREGDILKMKVLREKKYMTLDLKLERRPS
jgi:serine protease Do